MKILYADSDRVDINDRALVALAARLVKVGFTGTITCRIQEDMGGEAYQLVVDSGERYAIVSGSVRGLCYGLGHMERRLKAHMQIVTEKHQPFLSLRIAEGQYPFYPWQFPVFSLAGDWHDLPKLAYGSLRPERIGSHQFNKFGLNALEYAVIRYEQLCEELVTQGYNGITVADMLHAVDYEGVEHFEIDDELGEFLKVFHHLYRRIEQITAAYHLDLYFYTDEMVFPARFAHVKGGSVDLDDPDLWSLTEARYAKLFNTYPTCKGVLIRLGELYPTAGFEALRVEYYPRVAWGVTGKVAITREFIKRMQEIIITKHNRCYLHRTWDVRMNSVHAVPEVQEEIFKGIICDNFYVFTKHTKWDFGAGHPMNEVFGRYPNQIVEFQCKMEHSGMNDVPLFMGQDYASFLQKHKDDISGAWVWFYEGGRSRTMNYPYFTGFSKWTEANCYCIQQLMHDPSAEPLGLMKPWITAEYGAEAVDAMTQILATSYDAVLKMTQDENGFADMCEDGALNMYMLRWHSFFVEQLSLVYDRNKDRFASQLARKKEAIRDYKKMLDSFVAIESKIANRDLAKATLHSLEHAVKLAELFHDTWLIAFLLQAEQAGKPVPDYDLERASDAFNRTFKTYAQFYNMFDTGELLMLQAEAKSWLQGRHRYERVFEQSDDIFAKFQYKYQQLIAKKI